MNRSNGLESGRTRSRLRHRFWRRRPIGFSFGLGLSLVAGLLLAFSANEAAAFRMSVVRVTSSGASPTTLAFGDTVTIDLVIENEQERPILGIGLVAFGYDADRNRLADDGLRMVGAEAVTSIFNTDRTADGEASGGIEDDSAPFEIDFARQSGGGDDLGLYTSIFSGISLSAVASGTGSLDTGLGGRSIAEGDVHFRIAFQATSLLDPRQLTLHFGSGPTSGPESYGEGVLFRENGQIILDPVESALLTFSVLADPNWVSGSGGGGGLGTGGGPTGGTGGGSSGTGDPLPPMPEPGPALLLGFGLAGLSRLRPRA